MQYTIIRWIIITGMFVSTAKNSVQCTDVQSKLQYLGIKRLQDKYTTTLKFHESIDHQATFYLMIDRFVKLLESCNKFVLEPF